MRNSIKVWFKLFGAAGTWEKTDLKPSKMNREMKFPAGSIVEIDLEGPIVGDLKKIKIWVNLKYIGLIV